MDPGTHLAPCTRSLSGAQLLALEEEPLQLRVPACSVAVERGVKDVTEAAMLASDSKELSLIHI